MQCTANQTEIHSVNLGGAIANYLAAGLAIGANEPEDEGRLGAAFDTLVAWRKPAASFGEAIAALRIAFDEFRMGQEGDGLARPMLEAAFGYLGGANVSLPLGRKRWARRSTLKVAA